MLECSRELVDLAIDIGEGLLTNGAEIHRVEDTISRICLSSGAKDIDAFCIIKAMVISVRLDNGDTYTASRRILSTTTNYRRIDHYNTLSRKICAGELSLEEAKAEFERIKNGYSCSYLKKLLGYILFALSCTPFFGGSWLDALCTLPSCFLLIALDLVVSRHGLNKIIYNFIATFLIGSAIMLMSLTGLDLNVGPMIAGTLMILVPGIAMTSSLGDLLSGDTTSGILNLCESFLTACAISVGYALSIMTFGGAVDKPLVNYPWYAMIILAVISAIGYAFTANISTKTNPYLALDCALTYGTFLIVFNLSANDFLSVLAATAVATHFAWIAARVLKKPSPIFSTPSLIPLAPGYALYLTISCALNNDWSGMKVYALKTIVITFAIALGLIAVSFLWGVVRTVIKEIKDIKKPSKNRKR